jgi:hypothetical protein
MARLACSTALNIGKLSFSETSVNFYQTTWRNIPDDSTRYVNLFIFMKIGMKVMTVLVCEALYVRLNIVDTNMAALNNLIQNRCAMQYKGLKFSVAIILCKHENF